MNFEQVHRAIRPLRFVFWGGLIRILDFRIDGFDLLNDVIGAILIAVGVSRLAALPLDRRYARAMQFVQIMAILGVFTALYAQGDVETPAFFSLMLTLVGLASLAAIVVFCVAMRWFCQAAWLDRPAESWRVTTLLFAVIYAAPLGLFYLASGVAIVTGQSFHWNIGAAGCLLLLVFAVPLVHLFVSTSRMIRGAAEQLALSGSEIPLQPQTVRPRRPPQFTIRTLLLVTLEVAIVASFLAQPTTLYWHLVVVGLLVLGIGLWLLSRRKLAMSTFVVAALLLVGGMTIMTTRRSTSTVLTGRFRDRQQFDAAVGRLEDWLAEQGFVPSEPPKTPQRWGAMPRRGSEANVRHYVRRCPGSSEFFVAVKTDRKRRLLGAEVRRSLRGFPWEVRRQEAKIDQFGQELNKRMQPD